MDSHVETVALHETTRERYLNYALSVITSRALPDVRDGLKPVQRRILYGMQQLRLSPDARYVKSARVVGDVMGKFHPHGDTAIYDAMVRMAQPFSLRSPLVDGHGNFGSLDGDPAAAMRYTEARMTPVAVELLGSDLDARIVAFRPTYDASRTEPSVLPAGYPNLLVNGATGIAVGMATNIPPHNLREVVDACVALIDNPDIALDRLMRLMPGPDFPTGGRILNRDKHLRRIYDTGKGAVDLRGEYELEQEGRRQRIVVTSIPYMVDKSQLVERIADHIRANKIPQIVDVRDESTDQVRIVLDLRSGADPDTAMAYLFKHTPLQSRFHVNMTCLVPALEAALDDGHPIIGPDDEPVPLRPARVGLIELLRHFLDFRFEVVTRRLRVNLAELERRIHILRGFEIVFDALDEAIAIIRESRDRTQAAGRLQARFGLDADQTDAILEIRLYKLAQLEIEKIRGELEAKRSEAAHIRGLLADDGERWKLVRGELFALKRRHGDERRSTIAGPDLDLNYSREDYILEEDVHVIITREGWIKRQRSYSDLSTIRVRDGDAVQWALFGSTRRSVIIFSDRGRAYTMRIDSVPATTGYGEPIQAHFDFEDGEHVVAAMVTDERSLPPALPPGELPEGQASLFDEDELVELLGDDDDDDDDGEGEGDDQRLAPQLVAVSRAGQAVRMKYFAFESPSTVSGRRLMRLQDDFAGPDGDGDAVVAVALCGGGELVSLATYTSRALTFAVEEIGLLKGAGKGVKAISLDDGDYVLGMALTTDDGGGLEVETNRGRQLTVSPRKFPPVSRGSRGRLILKRGHLTAVHPPVVELKPDEPDDDATDDSPSTTEGSGDAIH